MADDDPKASYGALLDAVDGPGFAYCHLIHFPTPELNGLALVRQHRRGPVIANSKLDCVSAEALLAGGLDAVSFGRPYITNPDPVEPLHLGAPLTWPDRATFHTGEARGYTRYRALDGSGA
jgi:N-ethylmaleimide reductase